MKGLILSFKIKTGSYLQKPLRWVEEENLRWSQGELARQLGWMDGRMAVSVLHPAVTKDWKRKETSNYNIVGNGRIMDYQCA